MFNAVAKAAATVAASVEKDEKYLTDILEVYPQLEQYINQTRQRLGLYLQDKSQINLKVLLANEKALLEKINSNIEPNVNKLKTMESSVNNSYYALSESIGTRKQLESNLLRQIIDHEKELLPITGIISGNVAHSFPEKYNGFFQSPDPDNIGKGGIGVKNSIPNTPVPAIPAIVSPPTLNETWKIYPAKHNAKDTLDKLLGEGSNTLEPIFKALLKEKRGTVTDEFLLDAIQKTYEIFERYINDVKTNDEDFRTQLKEKYVNLFTLNRLDSFGFMLHSFIRLQENFHPNMDLKKPPANRNPKKNEHSQTSNTPYYKRILLDDAFIAFCSVTENRVIMEGILRFLETNKLTLFNVRTYFSELNEKVPVEFRKRILAIPSVKLFACAYIDKSGNISVIGSFLKPRLIKFLDINCSQSGGKKRKTRRTKKRVKYPGSK